MFARSLTWSVLAAVFVSAGFVACGSNGNSTHKVTARKAASGAPVAAGLDRSADPVDEKVQGQTVPKSDHCDAGPTSVAADSSAGEINVLADAFNEKKEGFWQLTEVRGWAHVEDLIQHNTWDYQIMDSAVLADDADVTDEKPSQDGLKMSCRADQKGASTDTGGTAAVSWILDLLNPSRIPAATTRPPVAPVARTSTAPRRQAAPIANKNTDTTKAPPAAEPATIAFSVQLPNSIGRNDGTFGILRYDRFPLQGDQLHASTRLTKKEGNVSDLKTLLKANPDLKDGKVEITDLGFARAKDQSSIILRYKLTSILDKKANGNVPAFNMQRTVFVMATYKLNDAAPASTEPAKDPKKDVAGGTDSGSGAGSSTGAEDILDESAHPKR